MSKMRLIGPWGNAEAGPRHVRPEGAAALDFFGQVLEAATGNMGCATVEISVSDVQQLGTSLRRVAAGEDARHVFGQVKVGHRQDDRLRNQTIAMLYWQTLAELLAAGEVPVREARQRAIKRAQQQFTDKPIDATTVGRYARTYRTAVLDWLAWMQRTGQGPDLAALNRHLAKHGEHMSDGPDLPPLRSAPRR